MPTAVGMAPDLGSVEAALVVPPDSDERSRRSNISLLLQMDASTMTGSMTGAMTGAMTGQPLVVMTYLTKKAAHGLLAAGMPAADLGGRTTTRTLPTARHRGAGCCCLPWWLVA